MKKENTVKKMLIVNTVLGTALLLLSVYLFNKLPQIVPVKIGIIGTVTRWGDKSNIFLLPIVLLMLSFIFSRSWIYTSIISILTNKVVQKLAIIFVFLIWLGSIILYVNYFMLIEV